MDMETGKLLPNAVLDHMEGRNKNGPHQTWIIGAETNARKETDQDPNYQSKIKTCFSYYQTQYARVNGSDLACQEG